MYGCIFALFVEVKVEDLQKQSNMIFCCWKNVEIDIGVGRDEPSRAKMF